MKNKVIVLSLFLLVAWVSTPAFAGIKEDLEAKLPVKTVLENGMAEGKTIEEVAAEASYLAPEKTCEIIRTAIEMYPDNAVPIVVAALEKGAEEEVAVRCAILAGADPALITEATAAGFAIGRTVPSSVPDGGNGGGGDLSPS